MRQADNLELQVRPNESYLQTQNDCSPALAEPSLYAKRDIGAGRGSFPEYQVDVDSASRFSAHDFSHE